ncbi:MAG: L-serine ammonia-lyase, iron-sulfur-dependent, subunit alpha [Armatimonadetes bacterium]|nr:L-serine ammonia-lyase, iron-sulfur-dependent, subunit alpha [Armatimonadota bacterium]
MKRISILNDVLGPIMRGPSSSHTAGSYHLGALGRSLLGGRPTRAVITFDADGSFAPCYRAQGSDLAFAAALLGWSITDDRVPMALLEAPASGLEIRFETAALRDADHPNRVHLDLTAAGGHTMHLSGRSVGGGAVEITEVDGWPVLLTGASHTLLVEVDREDAESAAAELACLPLLKPVSQQRDGTAVLLTAELAEPATAVPTTAKQVWRAEPLMFTKRGSELFAGTREMLAYASAQSCGLAAAALAYEAALLGIDEAEANAAMGRRLAVMLGSARGGLEPGLPLMQLLRPTAGSIFAAEQAGQVAVGGLHTRAAARAMAAMHINCGMGVVCAAPTAGSAGVLPGVLTTLADDRELSEAALIATLWAAGAVGLVVAERATFAAEVGGCQVEIGAAGAMAAAAVVEMAGGTAQQACDAAAVCFQNTMGSVCDLVQGIVEIPCHTRNAVAASSAFVVADLVLGGYENPVGLDETVDAVLAVGRMLPPELRVTSRGGLAVCPSALALPRLS